MNMVLGISKEFEDATIEEMELWKEDFCKDGFSYVIIENDEILRAFEDASQKGKE